MMSLVHEHNRSMNAHHAAKRARIAAGHTAQQPQFSGAFPCKHTDWIDGLWRTIPILVSEQSV